LVTWSNLEVDVFLLNLQQIKKEKKWILKGVESVGFEHKDGKIMGFSNEKINCPS
jgi:hypothetical protein